ncbi:MAG: hypothetical protein M3P18_23180 [Actinomycetota bacterium]|nr:hypothetical protein [Actinomycetota bacterium]
MERSRIGLPIAVRKRSALVFMSSLVVARFGSGVLLDVLLMANSSDRFCIDVVFG